MGTIAINLSDNGIVYPVGDQFIGTYTFDGKTFLTGSTYGVWTNDELVFDGDQEKIGYIEFDGSTDRNEHYVYDIIPLNRSIVDGFICYSYYAFGRDFDLEYQAEFANTDHVISNTPISLEETPFAGLSEVSIEYKGKKFNCTLKDSYILNEEYDDFGTMKEYERVYITCDTFIDLNVPYNHTEKCEGKISYTLGHTETMSFNINRLDWCSEYHGTIYQMIDD